MQHVSTSEISCLGLAPPLAEHRAAQLKHLHVAALRQSSQLKHLHAASGPSLHVSEKRRTTVPLCSSHAAEFCNEDTSTRGHLAHPAHDERALDIVLVGQVKSLLTLPQHLVSALVPRRMTVRGRQRLPWRPRQRCLGDRDNVCLG